MQILKFTADEPACYSQEYDLRNLVLRHPLGLDLKDEDLSRDKTDIHLGVFDGEKLVASLILHPMEDGIVQMRQVCTHPDRQGEGLGKMLVEAAEQLAKEEGFRQMVLHGRQTAAGFYRKLGYLTDDVVFTELGIPHISFSKLL